MKKNVRKDDKKGVLTLLSPRPSLDPRKPIFGSQDTRQPNAISLQYDTFACLVTMMSIFFVIVPPPLGLVVSPPLGLVVSPCVDSAAANKQPSN